MEVQIKEDKYLEDAIDRAGMEVVINPDVPAGEVWYMSSDGQKVNSKLKGMFPPKGGE